jgi:hypothetical protein
LIDRRKLAKGLCFASALVLQALPSHAAEFDPRLAAEVLRRLPEWPGARIEVPLAAYHQFLALQKLGAAGPRPPVPHLVEEQRHRLVIGRDATDVTVTLRVRVLDPTLAGHIPLLPAGVGFRETKLDGQPVKLVPVLVPVVVGVVRNDNDSDGNDAWADAPDQSDQQVAANNTPLLKNAPQAPGRPSAPTWLSWRPQKPGVYTFRARLRQNKGNRPTQSLRHPSVLATRNVVEIESPSSLEVRADQSVVPPLLGDERGTRGTMRLPPSQAFGVRWTPSLGRFEHTPEMSTSIQAACDLAAGVIVVSAWIDLRVRRTETRSFTLELPPGAERISVTGPLRVQGTGTRRTVRLDRPFQGRLRFRLRFEVPRPSSKGKVEIGSFGVVGARREGGYLTVANSGGGELLEDEARGLSEQALLNVPEEVLALSTEKPVFAYAIGRGKWRLVCDVVRSSELKLPPTLVDRAAHTVVVRPGGNVIAQADLEVRNSDGQFLAVVLPPGSTVRLVLVGDKAVAFTPVGRDAVRIPLERSITALGGLVSFPVQIIYTRRLPGFRGTGKLELALPMVNVPVAYTTCSLYAPPSIRLRRWDGTLKHVRRFTTEGDHAEMATGRVHRRDDLPDWFEPVTDTPTESAEKAAREAEGKSSSLAKRISGFFRPLVGEERARQTAAPRTDKPADGPDAPRTIDTAKVPAKPKPTVDLADNAYRAGLRAYRKRSLAEAAEQFENVIRLAPESPVAANARMLLRNARLAVKPVDRGDPLEAGEGEPGRGGGGGGQSGQGPQGKAGDARGKYNRVERAQVAQIARNIRASDDQTSREQRDLLEMAERLENAGRSTEATKLYGAALALGRELQLQGQAGKEEMAVTWRAETGLRRNLKQQKDVLEVERKLAKAKERVTELRWRGSAGLATKGRVRPRADGPHDDDRERALRAENAPEAKPVLDPLAGDATGAELSRTRGRAVPKGAYAELDKSRGELRKREVVVEALAKLVDADVDKEKPSSPKSAVGGKQIVIQQARQLRQRLQSKSGQLPQHKPSTENELEFKRAELKELEETVQKAKRQAEQERQSRHRQPPRAASTPPSPNLMPPPGPEEADKPPPARLDSSQPAGQADGGPFTATPEHARRPGGPVKRTPVTRTYTFGGVADRNGDDDKKNLAEFIKRTVNPGTVMTLTEGRLNVGKVTYQDGTLVVTHDKEGQELAEAGLRLLGENLGQKVAVRSYNTVVSEDLAAANGVSWNQGRNDLRWAVADAGLVRALMDLAQRRQQWRGFEVNPMDNPTVVGNRTVIANNDLVQVEAARDEGNWFNYRDNRIDLRHGRYLLVSNGESITIISATEMRHWTEQIEAAPVVVDVPPRFDLPRVGRLIKFEKTLIQPDDPAPSVRADYAADGRH